MQHIIKYLRFLKTLQDTKRHDRNNIDNNLEKSWNKRCVTYKITMKTMSDIIFSVFGLEHIKEVFFKIN